MISPAAPPPEAYRLFPRRPTSAAEYVLDVSNRRLEHHGTDIELVPKSFDVLVHLVRRAGSLVSRDEFHRTVWPGIATTDSVLNGCIHALRQALCDDLSDPLFIQTHAKHGYRFVGRREVLSAEALPPSEGVTPALADADRIVNRPPTHAAYLEIPNLELTQANRFHFAAHRVPFRGRDAELLRLKALLDDPRPLLWWLVEGPAGSGKSRLALQLCTEAVKQSWQAGFSPSWQDPRALSFASKPTLIVFDYASVLAESIRDFLLKAAYYCRSSGNRIRVLMLDRRHSDPRWQTFSGVGLTRHTLNALRFDEPLRLPSLSADELWNQVVYVTELNQQPTPDKRQFLKELNRLDRLGRPLLAHIAAEVLVADVDKKRRRDDLLREILQREDVRYWGPAGVTERDKTLLAFATLTGGVSVSDALTHPMLIDRVPSAKEYDPKRYEHMSGHVATERLHPLEPDLLGELFVLDFLQPRHAADSDRLLALWRAAWRLEDSDIAGFILRASTDYADHPGLTHTLTLDDPDARRVRAWVQYRALSVEQGAKGVLRLYQQLEEMVRKYPTEDGLTRPLAESLDYVVYVLVRSASAPGGNQSLINTALSHFERCRRSVGTSAEPAVWRALSRAALRLLEGCSDLGNREGVFRLFSLQQQWQRAFETDFVIVEEAAATAHNVILFLAGGKDATGMKSYPAGRTTPHDITPDDLARATEAYSWLRELSEAHIERPRLRYILAESTADMVRLCGTDHPSPGLPVVQRLVSLIEEYPDDHDLAVATSLALVNAICFVPTASEQWPLLDQVQSLQMRWPDDGRLLQQRIAAINNIAVALQPSDDVSRLRLEAEALAIVGDRHAIDEESGTFLHRVFTRLFGLSMASNVSLAEAVGICDRITSSMSPGLECGRIILALCENFLCSCARREGNRAATEASYARLKALVESAQGDGRVRQHQICSAAELLKVYRHCEDVPSYLALLTELQSLTLGLEEIDPGALDALAHATRGAATVAESLQNTEAKWDLVLTLAQLRSRCPGFGGFDLPLAAVLANVLVALSPGDLDLLRQSERFLYDLAASCDVDRRDALVEVERAFIALNLAYMASKRPDLARGAYKRLTAAVKPRSDVHRHVLARAEDLLIAAGPVELSAVEKSYQRVKAMSEKFPGDVGLKQELIGTGAILLMAYAKIEQFNAYTVLALELLDVTRDMPLPRERRTLLLQALEGFDIPGERLQEYAAVLERLRAEERGLIVRPEDAPPLIWSPE